MYLQSSMDRLKDYVNDVSGVAYSDLQSSMDRLKAGLYTCWNENHRNLQSSMDRLKVGAEVFNACGGFKFTIQYG